MRKLLLAAAALDAAVATSTHAQTAPSCPSTATLFWICSKPSTTRYAVRALRIGHVCGRFSRRTAALSQFPRDDDWITPSQNAATLSMRTSYILCRSVPPWPICGAPTKSAKHPTEKRRSVALAVCKPYPTARNGGLSRFCGKQRRLKKPSHRNTYLET